MSNKKLTITLSLIGLTTAALSIIAAINKGLNKLATSKGLFRNKNRETYHWRFGDISYSVKGEGKPILLIHNLKEDSSSVEWSELIPELSKTYTVYAIDLLGCGLSERPDLTYTSYMYTQLVNDFIDNIIKRKTSVITTGKSCSFVLSACSSNEDMYEEIILINPENIHSLNKAPSKRTKTASFMINLPIIGSFIYHIVTAKNLIEEDFEEHYYYDKDHISEALVNYYYESAHLDGINSKNLYSSLVGRYTNANITRTLKEINKNIHIIAGHEIPNVENDMKEYLYYNPAIEVEYIDYTKGLPQLEVPEEVLKNIKIFMYG